MQSNVRKRTDSSHTSLLCSPPRPPRSKYRPQSSEPQTDGLSVSTTADGSQPNVRKLCDTPPPAPQAHTHNLAYYDNIICQVRPSSPLVFCLHLSGRCCPFCVSSLWFIAFFIHRVFSLLSAGSNLSISPDLRVLRASTCQLLMLVLHICDVINGLYVRHSPQRPSAASYTWEYKPRNSYNHFQVSRAQMPSCLCPFSHFSFAFNKPAVQPLP